MKRIFRWLPALLACSALSVACSNDEPNTPNPGPGFDQPSEVLAKTPEGASIKFVSTDLTKFEWTITPGSECLSYRVEMKMKDRVLNDLWEAQKTNPDLTLETWAKQTMFATDGSGAATWEGTVDGESTEREFSSDMTVFQGFVYPDVEYYVMVWGCLSADGSNPAEFTYMPIKTSDPGPLVGKPQVMLSHDVGYRFTQAFAQPNEDCAYYNLLVLPQEHVDEYLAQEQFSEATLANVISSFSLEPISGEYRDQALDWGFDADPNFKIGTVAVARDGNLKASPTLAFDTYSVKEKPDSELPDYEYTFHKASAYAVRFRVEFDPEITANAYYYMGTAPYFENEAAMVQNGAWVVGPDQFEQFQYVSPETHYDFWFTARNFYSQLIPMEKVTGFDSKAVAGYDADKSLFEVSLGNVSKTQATVNYKPSDEISCWFFLALEKGAKYYDPVTETETDIDLTDPKNIETARRFLVESGNMMTQNAEMPEEDWSGFTFTAMEPAKEYVHLCMAETWEGKMVDVQYLPIKTSDNNGGKDPMVTFDMERTVFDAETMRWTVRFVPNQDVTKMYYCLVDETTAFAMLPDGEEASWDEKYPILSEYVLGEAGMSNAGNPSILGPTPAIADDMLALAVGYGATNPETNQPYVSPVAVLRLDYNTHQMEDLSQKAQSAQMQAALAKIVSKMQAQEAGIAKPLAGHTLSGKTQSPALLIRTK